MFLLSCSIPAGCTVFCDGLCPSSLIQCTLCPWRASHGRQAECQALCLLSPRERIQVPHIPPDPPCLSIQLPYLIDGSHKITQSNAILRYLARKHNLCGETEEERIRVDILENQAMDTRIQLAMVCYSPDFVSWSWPHTLALASALALFATRASQCCSWHSV